jgi:hypothetical protein
VLEKYTYLLFFGGFAALSIAVIVLNLIAERKRHEAFRVVAERLGLAFHHRKDHHLAQRLGFLNRLARGSNRYAYNVIRGVYREQAVTCFDYHYETSSGNSKDGQQTVHHNLSVYVLKHPVDFPELEIVPRKFRHRIGQMLGVDDIRFESVEFSRRFVAKSRARRFAYDVCHPRMMAFLMAQGDFNLEIEAHCIAICYDRRQCPDEVQPHLDTLVEIRGLIPEYLYAE